jgi:sec-independent protein translocase protein TatA
MLLIFGPEKLPVIARNIGKGIRQLRDATNSVKNEIIRESQKAGVDTEAIEKLKKDFKETKKIMDIKEEITNTIKRS